MSIQEKYQSLIDLANRSGISGLNVTEGEGFIRIEGTAPSAEVKQNLWDELSRLDPEYRSGDLVLNIELPEEVTYTIQAGDSLSKTGAHYNVSGQEVSEVNRNNRDYSDETYPGEKSTVSETDSCDEASSERPSFDERESSMAESRGGGSTGTPPDDDQW